MQPVVLPEPMGPPDNPTECFRLTEACNSGGCVIRKISHFPIVSMVFFGQSVLVLEIQASVP